MHFRKNILPLIAFGLTAFVVFTVGVLILNISAAETQWDEKPFAKR